MLREALLTPQKIQQLEIRSRILEFEDRLRAYPGSVEGDSDMCPLTHRFLPGLYLRTIHIPAGVALTGKLHREEHPIMLHSGIIDLVSEFSGGVERLEGPLFMVSEGFSKRAAIAITDVEWTSIHPNPTNTQDLEELEEMIIQSDLTEYKEELQCLLQ